MATSASFANTFAPGFRDIVGTNLERYSAQYSLHFNVETSERKYEDYLHQAGIPMAQPRAEGKPTPFFDPLEGGTKRFEHSEFAIGVQITKEAWDDDLYKAKSALRAAAGGLSDSMTERVEVDAADVYNSGFSGYRTIDQSAGGTNPYLFSAYHPRLDGGGDQSNLGTAAALSASAVQVELLKMEKWLSERGIRTPMGAVDLVYNIDDQFVVDTFQKTPTGLGASTANDYNPIAQGTGRIARYIKYPYLTLSGNAWFLRRAKHWLMFLWRERPTFDAYDDKNTRTAKFAAFMRYSYGPVHWMGILGNAGA